LFWDCKETRELWTRVNVLAAQQGSSTFENLEQFGIFGLIDATKRIVIQIATRIGSSLPLGFPLFMLAWLCGKTSKVVLGIRRSKRRLRRLSIWNGPPFSAIVGKGGGTSRFLPSFVSNLGFLKSEGGVCLPSRTFHGFHKQVRDISFTMVGSW